MHILFDKWPELQQKTITPVYYQGCGCCGKSCTTNLSTILRGTKNDKKTYSAYAVKCVSRFWGKLRYLMVMNVINCSVWGTSDAPKSTVLSVSFGGSHFKRSPLQAPPPIVSFVYLCLSFLCSPSAYHFSTFFEVLSNIVGLCFYTPKVLHRHCTAVFSSASKRV